MAIKIKSLEKIANTYTEQRFIYKDLSLDLAQTKIQAPVLTYQYLEQILKHLLIEQQ